MKNRLSLDAISLEVLSNSLRSVADEMYGALMRSAYSVNIKERQDHSTCLIDAQGRTVALAERTQCIHLSSMQGHLRALLESHHFAEMNDGDIFISNDPYAAYGSHLPDVNFAMPVFANAELVGFSCNIAHHADVGGTAPGSMASTVHEIYQEGLRLPVIRLFREGVLVQDVMDMILLNVRSPEERRGDYFAQAAACRLGAARFRALAEKQGLDRMRAAFDELIARTERRMGVAISQIPDGRYDFDDVLDDDAMGTHDIPIRVAVTVKGESIHVDFAGSSPQVTGNINTPLPATIASVAYALMVMLDNSIPANEGVLNAISVSAPRGSIVHPVFPAPVAARTHACQRIVDVVMGALAPALPGRAIGACNGANTTVILSGTDPRSGKPYLLFETLGGGCGGRPWKDGKDGIQIHVPNAANTPIEVLESEYPLVVDHYGWVEDSGGAGRFRGGAGLRRVLRPLGHSCLFTGTGERFAHRPWGVFAGHPGAPGQFVLESNNGLRTRLSSKPSWITIGPDQRLVAESPGAGGYGRPSERSREKLAVDYKSGKYNLNYLMREYGLAREEIEALALPAGALDYDED
jgi:N-methylhydantoinase B